jgi:hypothetical protein
MANSKSKHQRVRMKIRQAWKKRLDRKKAAAAEAGGKAQKKS